MSATKEYYHDEICNGQQQAAREIKEKPVPERKCKNCAYNLLSDGCGESLDSDDSCEYFSIPGGK